MKCVAGIISLTMIFQDIIYAQGAVSLNPAGGGRTRAEAVSESVTPPVSIIPYDSGTVAGGTDRNEKNQEMIFNIQDAHTSVSAQLSIAKILGSLVERYQMKIIALEGSEGFIDTSVLSAFPDRKIKEDAADFLLREGKISAGEFFAITNGQPVALYGIEESGLYIKNVEVFRGIIARRETDQKNIQALTRLLEALKEKIYSSSLLELDRRSEEFDAQKSSLDEYVGYLMKCAGRSETVDAYQNLSILFASRELEKEIDFGKADEERKEVIERLSLALTGPGLEALVKASVDFKTGKISPAVFHSYLLCCAAGQHIDFSGYKNFIRYARYLDRYSRLNFTGLFEELGLLKAAIKESLFRNETERTLSAICEKALLVRDLFETKLTAPSLAKLRAALKESDLGDIARFIAAHCGTYHISYAGDIDIGEFSKGIACSLAFYEAAEKRNAVIFANTIERMRSKHEKVAALVTGGFHTGGLVNIFNDQQISYLIIVPRLDPGTPGERPYVTILTNKTGSYIDSLRDNKNLALFSFFSASPEITQRLTGVKSCAGAIDAFAYCLGAMLLDGDNGRDIFFTKESPYWRSVRAAVEGNPEIPAEQQTALLRLYDALADRNNSVVVRTAAGEGEGVELYLNVPGYGIYGFSAARNSDGRTTLTPISGVTAESFAVLKRRSVSQGEGIRPSGYAAAVEEILADPEQVAELSGRFTAPFEERADWGHALTSVLLEAHGVAQAELSSERVTAARRVLLSRAHDNKEGLVVPWGDPDLAWLEPLAATSEAGPANAGQLKLREQFFRRMDTFVQEHLSAVSVDGRFSEEAFQSALTDDCGYRSVRGLSGVEERVSAIRQEIETRIAEQLRPAPAMAPTASAEEPSAKMARISPATRRELLRTICAKTESLTVAQAVEALPMMLSENGQVYGERAHFAYSTVAKDLKYLHDAGELERHASMTAVAGASGNLLPVRTFHYQRVVPALVAPVAAGPERVAVAPAPLVPASLLTNTAALPPADLFPAANVPVPLRSVASERPKRRARLSEAARRRRERKRTLTLEPLGGRLAITGVPGALVPDHIPGEEVVHSGSANATAHATIHIDKSVSTVRELPLLSKFFSGANVSVVIDINTVTVDIDRADLEKYVNEIRAGQKAHYADMREHTYVVISLELDPVDQKGRGSSVDVIKVSFADIESALKQTAGQQYVPFSRPSDPALYNLHVPPRAAVRLASETSKIAENRTLLGIASFKPHGSQAVAANKVATVQKSGGGGHAEAAHGGGGHGARKTTAPEKAKKHKILPKEKEEPPDVNKDEVKKEEGVRPEEVDTALADLLADEGGEFDMLALYETTDSTPGLDESSASAQAAAAALPIDTAEQRKRKGGQENGSARGFLKGLGWFAISAAALYEMVRRVRRSTAEDAAVAGSRDEAAIAAAMAELDQLQNGEAAPSWVRPAAKAAAVVVLCAVGCLWKMHMSHQGAVDPTSLDQTVPLMGMAGPMLGVFGSNLSPNNRRAALRDAKHRLNRAEKAVKRLRRAGASESQIDQARQVVSELRDNYELLRETSQRPSSSWVRNGAIVLLSAALWIAAFAGVFLPMTARHWAKDVEVPTVRSRAGVPEAVPPATPQGDEHQLQKMPDGTRPTLQGPPDDKEELDRLRKDSFFNNLLEREYDPVTARLEEELQKELIKQLGFKQSQAKSKTQRLQHEAEIAKVNKQMTEVSAEIARLTGLGKVYHFSKQWAANSLRVMRDINKRSPNSIADLDEMWHTLEVRLGTAATNEEVAAILTEAQEKLRPALEAEIAARRSGIAEADEAIELAQQGIVFSKNTTIPRIKSQIAQLGERLRGICAAIVQGKHGRQVALQVELVNHFTRTRDVNACDAMAAALGALETVFLNWYDNEEDRSGYLQVRGALHEYFTAIARRGGKTAATAALTKVQQERRSANQLSLVDMAIADTLAVLGVKTPPFFKVSTRAESIPVLSGSYVNDSPGKWSLRHKLVDQQKHIPDLPGHEPVLGLRAAAYQEICAALKNPVDFKRLLAAITDPDPVRRANAVQVCGTRPELAPLLTAVAAHETDLHVLEMCAAGLGAIEPAVSMPNLQDPRAPGFNRLSGLTGAETNNIRALAAFDWLTTVDDAQFAAAVSRILKEDTDELVQLGAILAAQQRPDPRLLKPLLEYLAPNTPSFYQLWAPASGFGSLFDEANRAVELIVQNHPEDTVVRNAVTDLQSASMGNPGLFVNGAGRLTHIRAPQDFWAPGEETFVWRPDTWTMLAIHFLWQMGVPVAVLNFLLWFVLRPRASADRRLDRWNLPALLLHLRTTQPPVLDHAASFTPAPFDRVPASESHATVDTASDRINNVWAVLPDYQAALSCWRTSLAQGRPLSREAVDAAGLIVVRIFTQLEAPWDHSRSLPHERDRLEAMQALLILHIGLLADQRRSLGQSSSQGTASGDAEALFLSDRERHAIDYLEYFRTYSSLIDAMSLLTMYLDSSNLRRAYLWAYGYNGLRDDALAFAGSLEDRFDQCRNACYENAALPGRATSSYRGRTQGWFDCELMGRRQRATVSVGDLAPRQLEEARQRHERSSTGGWLENSLRRLWTRDLTAFGLPVLGLGLYITLGGGYYEFVNATTGDIPSLLWFLFKTPISVGLGFLGATFIHRRQHSQMCRKIEERYRTRDEQIARLRRSASLGSGVPAYTQEYLGARRRDAAAVSRLRGATFAADCAQYAQQVGQLGRSDRMPVLIVATGSHGPAERERIREMLGGPHFDTTLIICVDDTFDGAVPLNDIRGSVFGHLRGIEHLARATQSGVEPFKKYLLRLVNDPTIWRINGAVFGRLVRQTKRAGARRPVVDEQTLTPGTLQEEDIFWDRLPSLAAAFAERNEPVTTQAHGILLAGREMEYMAAMTGLPEVITGEGDMPVLRRAALDLKVGAQGVAPGALTAPLVLVRHADNIIIPDGGTFNVPGGRQFAQLAFIAPSERERLGMSRVLTYNGTVVTVLNAPTREESERSATGSFVQGSDLGLPPGTIDARPEMPVEPTFAGMYGGPLSPALVRVQLAMVDLLREASHAQFQGRPVLSQIIELCNDADMRGLTYLHCLLIPLVEAMRRNPENASRSVRTYMSWFITRLFNGQPVPEEIRSVFNRLEDELIVLASEVQRFPELSVQGQVPPADASWLIRPDVPSGSSRTPTEQIAHEFMQRGIDLSALPRARTAARTTATGAPSVPAAGAATPATGPGNGFTTRVSLVAFAVLMAPLPVIIGVGIVMLTWRLRTLVRKEQLRRRGESAGTVLNIPEPEAVSLRFMDAPESPLDGMVSNGPRGLAAEEIKRPLISTGQSPLSIQVAPAAISEASPRPLPVLEAERREAEPAVLGLPAVTSGSQEPILLLGITQGTSLWAVRQVLRDYGASVKVLPLNGSSKAANIKELAQAGRRLGIAETELLDVQSGSFDAPGPRTAIRVAVEVALERAFAGMLSAKRREGGADDAALRESLGMITRQFFAARRIDLDLFAARAATRDYEALSCDRSVLDVMDAAQAIKAAPESCTDIVVSDALLRSDPGLAAKIALKRAALSRDKVPSQDVLVCLDPSITRENVDAFLHAAGAAGLFDRVILYEHLQAHTQGERAVDQHNVLAALREAVRATRTIQAERYDTQLVGDGEHFIERMSGLPVGFGESCRGMYRTAILEAFRPSRDERDALEHKRVKRAGRIEGEDLLPFLAAHEERQRLAREFAQLQSAPQRIHRATVATTSCL